MFPPLLGDIGLEQKSPTTLVCDYQGAISIQQGEKLWASSEKKAQIYVKYHHIKYQVTHIEYPHCSLVDQKASQKATFFI
jgi:hypothetical protein